MKTITIKTPDIIEEQLRTIGATDPQARVIGAVMRGVAADIINERADEIRFACHGVKYKLTLAKEN